MVGASISAAGGYRHATDGQSLEAEYDLIVLGAGAGGMAAAITAQSRGLKVAIFEKTSLIGGTGAVSGGACWVPANHSQAAQGIEDSIERASIYLDNVVPTKTGRDLRQVYLRRAPEAVKYLEDVADLVMPARPFTPDYHSDTEGAQNQGRVMVTKNFDGSLLGERFNDLRGPLPENCLFGKAMVDGPDLMHLLNSRRSLRSAWHAVKFMAAYALDRLRHPNYRRGSRLTTGNAMVARMYRAILDRRIPVFLDAGATALRVDGDRVCGIELPGGIRVDARWGVVLATGGFPGGLKMRAALLPGEAGRGVYTAAPRDNTGDGIALGQTAGAAMDDSNMQGAFWCPVSTGTRTDGSIAHFPHLLADRPKPGLIAIDRHGRRFTNESEPYHSFVQAMLAGDHLPVHLICDHGFIRRYPFGITRPAPFPLRHHLRSGYLISGRTIEDLARALSVDPQALRATVDRFNEDARAGVDREFGRGSTIYQRNLGDARVKPNPSLGPIRKGPFYAIKVDPGDIGTIHGLAADEHSRALDADGHVVPGLYACGNDRASVMGGAYPAGGITLGPVLTFAYLAAMHAADSAQMAPAEKRQPPA
ncbi:MAG: FAD-dependent oxidoreductase [Rhizobiaceae bacterium]|nr:FAD-dependent oxidoreductase [Rhizobiaceae bacterium]